MEKVKTTREAPKVWRIAFLRRRFSPTGGAERYLLRLAAGLRAAGHQLTLYCEEWSPRETPFHTISTVESNSPADFSYEITRRPLRDRHDIIFSLERVPGCDIYRAGDGVHAEWLHYREKFSPLWGRLRTAMRGKNQSVCELEARVLRPEGTRRVICNSNFVAQQIMHRFHFPENRIDIIPNGVPYKEFSQGDRSLGRRALNLSATDYVVLLVGAGKERKGHDLARQAVKMAAATKAKLVIIDHPPSVAMPHVYAAADVFLLPSLYDPFANVTLEALAAGLPVITSAQNGASEILTNEKNGYILPQPTDIKLAADYLGRLSDPAYRAKFSIEAQTLAKQYDLQRNVHATLEVFPKLFPKS